MAPASEVNENVGVLSPVVPLGPAVIVVSGAVVSDVSTVKDRLAGVGSVRPTPSVARTSKTCAPSDRAPVVNGELQDANAAASTRHSNVEPASVAVNVNVGVPSPVVPLGPAVIVVSGAVVSTVNARVAGEASALPRPSLARTSNVCAPSDSAPVVNGVEQDANAAAVDPAREGGAGLVGGEGERRRAVGRRARGPAVIVVSGGVVSTVNAGSPARRRRCRRRPWPHVNVCAPSVSAPVRERRTAGRDAAASTRHSNVEPARRR